MSTPNRPPSDPGGRCKTTAASYPPTASNPGTGSGRPPGLLPKPCCAEQPASPTPAAGSAPPPPTAKPPTKAPPPPSLAHAHGMPPPASSTHATTTATTTARTTRKKMLKVRPTHRDPTQTPPPTTLRLATSAYLHPPPATGADSPRRPRRAPPSRSRADDRLASRDGLAGAVLSRSNHAVLRNLETKPRCPGVRGGAGDARRRGRREGMC